MSDNGAVLDGYTKEYLISSSDGTMDIHVSVKPYADLDGMVRCWDHDEQEYVRVLGWNWHWVEV